MFSGVVLLGLEGGAAALADADDRRAVKIASHQRMVATLAAIAKDDPQRNPFLRRPSSRDTDRRLADLPATASALERGDAHLAAALDEFYFGTLARALELFNRAEPFYREADAGRRTRLEFHRGLALLRQGERRNCVASHRAESCILPIRPGGVHHEKQFSRAAAQSFRRVLAAVPPNSYERVATRWLLNVAHMTLGDYPGGLSATELIPPARFAAAAAFPELRDVAPALGLDVFDLAGGAAIEDFDGDGFLDLLTSSWAPGGNVRYFLNRGDGTFAERTREANLEGITGGLNLNHTDYDNDGDADVLILRGGWLGAGGRHPNSLLENQGDGTFLDVTYAAGLALDPAPSQTAAWADYDNDGDLDLYVGYEDAGQPTPCRLYRNNGDRTFTDVARSAGVENGGFTKAVAWGDFDGDGFADLYVSNFGGDNRLYRNRGNATFEDVAPRLGVTGPKYSFPAWFWDYDNDGALDLFVASYPYEARAGLRNLFFVAAGYLGASVGETSKLYRGDGDGGFSDVTSTAGVGRVTMPMGANFGDLDNDGFLDFYLGTGYPAYDGLIPNLLYHNRGGRRFADVTSAARVGHLQKGHGVVFADVDNDGDQDLFEQMGGFFPDDGYGNVLFENPGFDANWIKLTLAGVESNRFGVGARVRVDVVENGERRSIFRRVGTGGSFGSNPLTLHVGLGSASTAETIEVFWPASGRRQTATNVRGNRLVEIREGREGVVELPHRPLKLARPGG